MPRILDGRQCLWVEYRCRCVDSVKAAARSKARIFAARGVYGAKSVSRTEGGVCRLEGADVSVVSEVEVGADLVERRRLDIVEVTHPQHLTFVEVSDRSNDLALDELEVGGATDVWCVCSDNEHLLVVDCCSDSQ